MSTIKSDRTDFEKLLNGLDPITPANAPSEADVIVSNQPVQASTVQTVVVSLVKALDWIRQINSDAKIYFLQFGDPIIVRNRATRMCDYLQYDYFKQFKFTFPVSVYICTYNEIIDKVRQICDIITIFDAEMISDEYISDDGIHPNVKGHKRIAFNILEQI